MPEQPDRDDDDLIDIRDDEVIEQSAGEQPVPWVIICADDDDSAHRSTAFALDGEMVEGRPVQLVSAYSAAEAINRVREHPEAAAILLDVVMETPQAGLEAIAKIREQLGRKALRIIVRSGAPGLMGEFEAVKRFDISDWRPKAELTQTKLLASITLAVRSFCELTNFESRQMGLDQALGFLERLAKDSSDSALLPDILAALSRVAGRPIWMIQRHGDLIRAAYPGEEAPDLERHFPNDMRLRSFMEQSDRWEHELEPAMIAGVMLGVSIALPQGVSLDFGHPIVSSLIRALRGTVIGSEKSLHERELSMRDSATGTLNRIGFIHKSGEAVRAKPEQEWAVFLVDLAGFGRVNAALGHEAGDAILSDAALRLRAAWPDHPIGRIASDAFAMLLPKAAYTEAALELAFADPLDSGKFPVSMKARVGAAEAKSLEASTLWLTRATAALDEAKTAGLSGGVPRWFDPKLESQAHERMSISQRLFTTLKTRDGLFMVFQPQVDLNTGVVSGVEALIRWRDEQGNMIPPDRFIPIAEQAGLAQAISEFALESSLAMMRRALDAGVNVGKISVNISAVEFETEGLAGRVASHLEKSGVPANCLELEITETAAARDPERMIRILTELRALGVCIAIDDFGSGYSSLAQLAKLPVDKLKIDRAFVRAIGVNGPFGGISKMIVDLGKSLSMSVVAEGVEEPEQAQALFHMGADAAQGWLYAKAMPEGELFEFIQRGPHLKFTP